MWRFRRKPQLQHRAAALCPETGLAVPGRRGILNYRQMAFCPLGEKDEPLVIENGDKI
jgi:hypothetical protein